MTLYKWQMVTTGQFTTKYKHYKSYSSKTANITFAGVHQES